MTGSNNNTTTTPSSSAAAATTNTSNTTTTVPFYLPLHCDEHKIQWKVKAGNAVRKGETLALTTRKQANSTTSNNSSQTAAQTKKTPQQPPMKKKSLLGMIQAQKATAANKTFQETSSGSSSAGGSNSSNSISKPSDSNATKPTKNNNNNIKIISPADGLLRFHFFNKKDGRTLLGYIEPCKHPTMIDGLCVVCGKSPNSSGSSSSTSTSSDHNKNKQQQRAGAGTTRSSKQKLVSKGSSDGENEQPQLPASAAATSNSSKSGPSASSLKRPSSSKQKRNVLKSKIHEQLEQQQKDENKKAKQEQQLASNKSKQISPHSSNTTATDSNNTDTDDSTNMEQREILPAVPISESSNSIMEENGSFEFTASLPPPRSPMMRTENSIFSVADSSPHYQHQQRSSSSFLSPSDGASSLLTVSGGITMNVSAEEAAQISNQNRLKLLKSQKLSLVLDLDHTLVHATGDPRAASEVETREDVRLILLPNPIQQDYPLRHFVKMRPNVKEFLYDCMEKYEISIYTAGTRAYALQVARVISRYMVGSTVDEEEYNHWKMYYMEMKRQLDYRLNKQSQPKKKVIKKQQQQSSSRVSFLDQQQQQRTPSEDGKQDTSTTMEICMECQSKKPLHTMTKSDGNDTYICDYCVGTRECTSCGERKFVNEFPPDKDEEKNKSAKNDKCLECSPSEVVSSTIKSTKTSTIENASPTSSNTSGETVIDLTADDSTEDNNGATTKKNTNKQPAIKSNDDDSSGGGSTVTKRKSPATSAEGGTSTSTKNDTDSVDESNTNSLIPKKKKKKLDSMSSEEVVDNTSCKHDNEGATTTSGSSTAEEVTKTKEQPPESSAEHDDKKKEEEISDFLKSQYKHLLPKKDTAKDEKSNRKVDDSSSMNESKAEAAIDKEGDGKDGIEEDFSDKKGTEGDADPDSSEGKKSNFEKGDTSKKKPIKSVLRKNKARYTNNGANDTKDDNDPMEDEHDDTTTEDTSALQQTTKNGSKKTHHNNKHRRKRGGGGGNNSKRKVGFSDEVVTSTKEFIPHDNEHGSYGEMDLEELQNEIKEWEGHIQQAEESERKARDLERKLFGNRIVSRCDVGDLGRDVKSLKRVFPCGGLSAAIVDDREDVWANSADNNLSDQGNDDDDDNNNNALLSRRKGEPPMNLLLLKPYHYQKFRGYAEVNNAAGEDLSATTTTTETAANAANATNITVSSSEPAEDDDALYWINDILRRVHKRYFLHVSSITASGPGVGVPPPSSSSSSYLTSIDAIPNELTVSSLLHQMRKEVLRGCYIVLSGLIPMIEQQRHNAAAVGGDITQQPPRPNVLRYAEDLGATIQQDVDERTTHVIAARTGTAKVFKGSRVRGCAIVNVGWLMSCYWTVTLKDVSNYLLVPIRLKDTDIRPPPTSSRSNPATVVSGKPKPTADNSKARPAFAARPSTTIAPKGGGGGGILLGEDDENQEEEVDEDEENQNNGGNYDEDDEEEDDALLEQAFLQ